MMANIQVYADSISLVEKSSKDIFNVHLNGVALEQVIAEFNYRDVLGSIDFLDIYEWVQERMQEDAEIA